MLQPGIVKYGHTLWLHSFNLFWLFKLVNYGLMCHNLEIENWNTRYSGSFLSSWISAFHCNHQTVCGGYFHVELVFRGVLKNGCWRPRSLISPTGGVARDDPFHYSPTKVGWYRACINQYMVVVPNLPLPCCRIIFSSPILSGSLQNKSVLNKPHEQWKKTLVGWMI